MSDFKVTNGIFLKLTRFHRKKRVPGATLGTVPCGRPNTADSSPQRQNWVFYSKNKAKMGEIRAKQSKNGANGVKMSENEAKWCKDEAKWCKMSKE